MNLAYLVLTAVILAQGQPAPPEAGRDIAPLVAKLGSDSPADRDAATSTLRSLGAAALAPLRAARNGNDSALQARAAALIRAIEGDLLIRPRNVSLDYQERPMSDVIADLTERTGCRISIYEKHTDWLATRITLRTPSPMPFWAAVDRVCEAGRFGSNLGLDADGACIMLFRGESIGPVADHGPFRVQLVNVHYNGRYGQLHLRSDGQPASRRIFREEDRENSYVELGVNVEPRMLMKNAGKLKDLSAVDERGQSLLPDDPVGMQDTFEFGFTPAASTLGRVPLAKVKHPGKVIKLLRGVAPVAVAALRAEPVVIPLPDAAGKSFPGDDTVLTVREVSRQAVVERIVVEPIGPDGKIDRTKRRPTEGTVISLTVRPIDRHGPPATAPELSEEQFEVVDPAGKAWTATPQIFTGETPEVRGGEVRFTLRPSDENLMPMPWPRDLQGFTLRYREMTVVPVDVPFEFRDVPLP